MSPKAHLDRTVGVGPLPRPTERPPGESVGRCRAPAFARGSPQRLAALVPANRNSRPSRWPSPCAENSRPAPPPVDTGNLISGFFGKCRLTGTGRKVADSDSQPQIIG